jgi:hypothetical protein
LRVVTLAGFVVLALAGCGGDDEDAATTPPAPADPRCEQATSAIMTPLGNAVKNELDRFRNGWIVKSRDHSDIYFVSAELDGPGFEDPGDVGTWATTSPGGAAAIFSVDDLAKDHTTWRDGTAVAGLSLDDDGAEESRACAGG